MHNPIKRTLIITAIILAGVPLVALAQWTSAPPNPPSGNIAAPINAGPDNQIKTGGLEVASLLSDGGTVIMGNLGVGAINPAFPLTITTSNPEPVKITSTNGGGYAQILLQATGRRYQIGVGDAAAGLGVANRFFVYDGDAAAMRLVMDTSGNLGVGTAAPGYKLQVGASGDGTAIGANAYYYISDRALKTNVNHLTGSLAKVLKLDGVSFNWKSTGESSVGVIAQDVEKVYPELVNIDQTTGYKSVEYGNLVAPLIEAVKEQQKQIDTLKAEVEALKAAK